MTKETRINLHKGMFKDLSYDLLVNDAFRVRAFKYSTGIEALEVSNSVCGYILLPFKGQQVWRLKYQNESYTMKSIFDEPQDTDVFDLTYGAHLIHCGLMGMGNPSEEDDHPLHGELPNAHYQEAFIETFEDEKGSGLAISRSFQYRNGLEYNYKFSPYMRLYAHDSVLYVDAKIENLRERAFKFMYMAHINWLPMDGSKLVYSAKKDLDHVEVYHAEFDIEDHDQEALDYYAQKLQENLSMGDIIDSQNQVYYPELCVNYKYASDDNHKAYALKILPKGLAYYVGFDTEYLPYGLRWVARTGDEDAMGFALPTTGNHLGRSYAVKNNLLRTVDAKSSVTLHYEFGFKFQEEIDELEETIKRLIA